MATMTTWLTVLAASMFFTRGQSCQGQSCDIGDLSGSTGLPFTATTEPIFPTQGQECCIISYNPAAAQQLYKLVPGLEAKCQAGTEAYVAPLPAPAVQCMPKVLIFAAGTSQPTAGGGPLGMSLQSELDSLASGVWIVQGIPYTDDINGLQCLGLGGGVTGKEMIANYVSQCPKSALFVGGYSQGAFVARESVGNSSLASHVNAVITFGDPMNGSPIKGYSGPIHITCHQGDGVCGGYPDVGPEHLNYAMNAGAVASYLNGVQVSGAASTSSSSAAVSSSMSASASAPSTGVGGGVIVPGTMTATRTTAPSSSASPSRTSSTSTSTSTSTSSSSRTNAAAMSTESSMLSSSIAGAMSTASATASTAAGSAAASSTAMAGTSATTAAAAAASTGMAASAAGQLRLSDVSMSICAGVILAMYMYV